MKKTLSLFIMLMAMSMNIMAEPAISFEKTSHNFGTFSEANATGDKPLVINQAVASCGCTVPKHTKTPVAPGAKGTIEVVYNGQGKFPGHFKKTITVRSNGTPEMVRLYIEGDMTEK